MLNVATLSTDSFKGQHHAQRFSTQLKQIYRRIKQMHPFVSCVELALRSHQSKNLEIHATSCPGTLGYHLHPCMQANKQCDEAVVNDLSQLIQSRSEHEQQPRLSNIRSGLRVPVQVGELRGFAFFSSDRENAFTPEIIDQMRIYTRVIGDLLNCEQQTENRLKKAIDGMLQLNHVDLAESPEHLKRVAHCARFIASQVASWHDLSDDWIDHLFLFAPLHDIGKAFMPAELLNKPGRFTPEEFEQMKTHTLRGLKIVDHSIEVFDLKHHPHIDMLRNIVVHHHETIDGLGYPHGLAGQQIPLEARIVAVADVLDALLAKRVYKQAWSVDNTLAELRKMAGNKLEAELVAVIIHHIDAIMDIRQQCTSTSLH